MLWCCFPVSSDQWQLSNKKKRDEGGSERNSTSIKRVERPRKETEATTSAAGVFEWEDKRRDCELSTPITSTHLLPYPAMSFSGCMPCTQHWAASGTHNHHHMLPDYSAAVNQYSQAPGFGTPLELLLAVCSFIGIVCAHGPQFPQNNTVNDVLPSSKVEKAPKLMI